jgi:hypothetical protein
MRHRCRTLTDLSKGTARLYDSSTSKTIVCAKELKKKGITIGLEGITQGGI